MFAFEDDDWISDSYGMRSKLIPATFNVPAERLTECRHPGRPANAPAPNDRGTCMSSYPYSTNRTAGIMNADELAELRQVFNEACRRSSMAPSAAPAKFIASGLLTAFRAGVSDRELLLRLVSNPSNYPYKAAERPKITL